MPTLPRAPFPWSPRRRPTGPTPEVPASSPAKPRATPTTSPAKRSTPTKTATKAAPRRPATQAAGGRAGDTRWRTPPRTSPFSRASSPSASGPGCTSDPPAHRPAPPRLRGRRQLGRRGDGRRVPPASTSRCSPTAAAASSTTAAASRSTPHPEYKRQVGGRDRAHDAARRREVRRRGLQDLRRPARRRRVGRERAVEPARARDPPRRRQVGAALREGRRAAGQAQARRGRRSSAAPRSRSGPTPRSSRRPSSARRRCSSALREMAFLNKGLEIRFTRRARRPGRSSRPSSSRGGIVDFVKHLNASKEPLFKRVVSFEDTGDGPRGRDRDAVEHRLLRGHPLVRQQHRHHRGRDARRGLQEGPHERGQPLREGQGPPQGEGRQPPRRGHPRGPHRDRLGEAAQPAVRGPDQERSSATPRCARSSRRPPTRSSRDWLEEHPTEARQIVSKATQAAHARAWPRARRATSPGASRCSSRRRCRASSPTARRSNPAESELFIVEGDSAGGSAKRARDPHIQAILPIRGKILNVERARIDKMLKNEEIQALITAIGTGIGEEFDRREAPLPQDHHHGRRRRRRLAHPHAAAHVLLPPAPRAREARLHLHRAAAAVSAPTSARSARTSRTKPRCAAFEAEHDGRKIEINRFKGLGEMDWQELGETTMDPATRTLLRVSVEEAAIADEVFSKLMGDDVESRARRSSSRTPRTSASSTSERRVERGQSTEEGEPHARRRRAADARRNIEPVEIQEEMERSFLDYAMSVITARALPDVRDGLKPVHRRILYGMYDARAAPRPQAPEVGAGGRRGDGQVPPARRRGDLRRARAHGPGLLAALPADRRPRELRLARPQRPPGRGALHRGAARAAGDGAARRDRRGHRRLHADVRRREPGAARPPGPVPEPARQRRRRHRGRHGHEHPAAQPRRGHRRGRSTCSTTPTRRPTTS